MIFVQDNGIRKEGHRLDAVPHEINALYRVLSFYPDPAPYPHLYQEVCRCHTLQSDTLSSSLSHHDTQDIASAFLKVIPGILYSVQGNAGIRKIGKLPVALKSRGVEDHMVVNMISVGMSTIHVFLLSFGQ